MSQESLNIRHIRDFLDYVEAEAMTGVHEQSRAEEPHRDFLNALKVFIGTYGVHLPLVVVPSGFSPAHVRMMRDGYLRDWQAHWQAIQTLRPLCDLVLAVAEKQSQEEQSRLHRAAFPRGSDTSA